MAKRDTRPYRAPMRFHCSLLLAVVAGCGSPPRECAELAKVDSPGVAARTVGSDGSPAKDWITQSLSAQSSETDVPTSSSDCSRSLDIRRIDVNDTNGEERDYLSEPATVEFPDVKVTQ